MGHTTEGRTWGEAQSRAWGWSARPAGWGPGPHLGLLPELLAVNPLHFHSCIRFLVGGALQNQMAWHDLRGQV